MRASPASAASAAGFAWPQKHDVLGVQVSATDYDDALTRIIRAAKLGLRATVDHLSLHGLTPFGGDPTLRSRINSFDLVVPDGQPVRWALNRLHGTELRDRVYGPELMGRLCARAAEEGIPIYLYGAAPATLAHLAARLVERYPGLRIAGSESPPFRPLSPEEAHAAVDRINRSGARLVFLGIGCPKQEAFAYEHRHEIAAVQLCVGAAFDFLAGEKRMAPRWMQDRGLEWLFRLVSEPRRLWRRYLVAGATLVVRIARELTRSAAERRSVAIAADSDPGKEGAR
jgi:N-acetylglucosaminyldiphosphoundecaprenol N-acetyl-beta-D-mannosaminyltransferase